MEKFKGGYLLWSYFSYVKKFKCEPTDIKQVLDGLDFLNIQGEIEAFLLEANKKN